MPGHPDGQNYAIWRGPDFFANAAVHIDSTHPVIVAGQITNYASMHLNVNANTVPGVTVGIQYFLDAGLTIPLSSPISWIVPVLTSMNVLMPAMGNYVGLNVTTTDPVGGSAQLSFYPTNVQAPHESYICPDNFIQNANLVVPASTTIHVPMPFVAEGDAYAWISDPAASGHIQAAVHTLKVDSTVNATIVIWNVVASFQAQQFIAPATPIEFTIINTDAAASHAVDFFMSVDGR